VLMMRRPSVASAPLQILTSQGTVPQSCCMQEVTACSGVAMGLAAPPCCPQCLMPLMSTCGEGMVNSRAAPWATLTATSSNPEDQVDPQRTSWLEVGHLLAQVKADEVVAQALLVEAEGEDEDSAVQPLTPLTSRPLGLRAMSSLLWHWVSAREAGRGSLQLWQLL
jgi:hypothetical protein